MFESGLIVSSSFLLAVAYCPFKFPNRMVASNFCCYSGAKDLSFLFYFSLAKAVSIVPMRYSVNTLRLFSRAIESSSWMDFLSTTRSFMFKMAESGMGFQDL
jgi:hypothetical protein